MIINSEDVAGRFVIDNVMKEAPTTALSVK
jgi:hypothetical protein